MTVEKRIGELVDKGILPADVEVISTHNNLVVLSRSQQMVARVGVVSSMKLREDPGDVEYSHAIAWTASDYAPVVRPLTERPIQSGDSMVSKFPLMHAVTFSSRQPGEILALVEGFNDALEEVNAQRVLRQLDVSKYAQARIDRADNRDGVGADLQHALNVWNVEYPFSQLSDNDPGLIHGDLHTGNIVEDDDGNLRIIDLDSTAKGPRLYDLAAWRVRQEMGDVVPIIAVVERARQSGAWDEDAYRGLVGWKLLSSMTHSLRYEKPTAASNQIASLQRVGAMLGITFGDRD